MGKFVNIHTHQSSTSGNIEVINHLVQDEWNPGSDKFYSVGFHPWHINDFNLDKMIERIKFLANNKNVLAIGECGLDRAIETPLKIQEAVFLKQVEVAEKLNKPLVIHAVRSYPDLIRIKKQTKSEIPWILHGYNGNKQTTKQLLAHDFYFSFGSAILKDQQKLNESLQLIPTSKLFFETDESSKKIETIYKFAAGRLQLTTEELETCILNNFKLAFNHG